MTTITQEQRDVLFKAGGRSKHFDDALARAGIAVKQEPPAEMVKLARAYADSLGLPSAHEYRIAYEAHLAALQHAVDVVGPIVMNERHWTRDTLLDDLLTALGAGGRDAG
jgi:hypothetical protein